MGGKGGRYGANIIQPQRAKLWREGGRELCARQDAKRAPEDRAQWLHNRPHTQNVPPNADQREKGGKFH